MELGFDVGDRIRYLENEQWHTGTVIAMVKDSSLVIVQPIASAAYIEVDSDKVQRDVG